MTILRTRAQRAAMAVWQKTLPRIRADVLVRKSCWRESDRLYIAGAELNLAEFDRVVLLAAGKASAAMAQALEAILPIDVGLVATKYGHALPLGSQIRCIEAGHPLPDMNSVEAGEAMLGLASTATERDLVIVAISGGASAIVEAPVAGVTINDIANLTHRMLRDGFDIQQLNAVRSCLSRIKAGGLARACGGARIVCLLLSDVIGNRRETIGSGPCWGAPDCAPTVGDALRAASLPLPEQATPVYPEHVVVGDIYTLLEEAQKAAEDIGLRPKVYGRTFGGEAREVGAAMAAEGLTLKKMDSYDAMIAAGESTVTVRGNGTGGRNQELACASALALADEPDIALLSIGTDGTDGPTDAAGGLIDGYTHRRTDLRRALATNDSYHALEIGGALLKSGPTQTNLNDLVVVTRIPE